MSSSLTRKAKNRAKLWEVLQDGPFTVVQLKHRTGLSDSAIRSHLRELEAEGVLERMRVKAPRGRGYAYGLRQTAGQKDD
jgi:predicted ArsR family transcriptional regulator